MIVFEAVPIENRSGLRLAGELDMQTVSRLREAALNLNGAPTTVIDCAGLEFIDSSGIHAIVQLATVRPVVLENMPARFERLFEITGLDSHPNIELRGLGDGDE